jgi:hypothetical protein
MEIQIKNLRELDWMLWQRIDLLEKYLSVRQVTTPAITKLVSNYPTDDEKK